MLQRSVRKRGEFVVSIYKDITGKWRVVYRHTDWTGNETDFKTRGFLRRRSRWEHEQC